MSQDPHAQLDQTVLDVIEHSPVGAVPHTPSYQDALRRLEASHQVYTSADYKNGHVTARSLARLPSFHASNLDAFIAGEIAADALESNASIFSRYVQSLPAALRPQAEASRARVAARPAAHRSKHDGTEIHDPLNTLFLVPGAGPHPGLPGNYLYGSVIEIAATSGAASSWQLKLHDNDDGAATYEAATLAAALAELQEVVASAPFLLSELEALGFKSN